MACRWCVMGGEIENDPYPGDLSFNLLGMVDYRVEMELVVGEWRENDK